jgi:hypothetical protein
VRLIYTQVDGVRGVRWCYLLGIRRREERDCLKVIPALRSSSINPQRPKLSCGAGEEG